MANPIHLTGNNPWAQFRGFVENRDIDSSEILTLLVLPIIGDLTQWIKEKQIDSHIRSSTTAMEKTFWQSKKMSLLHKSLNAACLQSMLGIYMASMNPAPIVDLGYQIWISDRIIDCYLKIRKLREEMPVYAGIIVTRRLT